jgi:hypothetical protein
MAEVQKHKYDVLAGALTTRELPGGDQRDPPRTVVVWDEFHHIRFSLAAVTFDEAEEFALKRLEQVLGAPRAQWKDKAWAIKSITLDGDVAIVPKPSGLVVPS